MVFEFLTGKRLRQEDSATTTVATTMEENNNWKVVRLAAKNEAQRRVEGGSFKSPMCKITCPQLELQTEGATGIRTSWFGVFQQRIVDFNHYRSQGHTGRFEAKTTDRAISLATAAAYDKLQKELGDSGKVQHGDLGENILIEGPVATSSKKAGLYVGAKLSIGTSTVQITEANNPCYRFNAQTWAAAAKRLWGDTAPDGNAAQWFKSPKCPLNHQVNPGVRGWLAKVVQEGTAHTGDAVRIVMTNGGPPPAKRRKMTASTKLSPSVEASVEAAAAAAAQASTKQSKEMKVAATKTSS